MRLFNKVAIIGMGLIGGSLALAIRKKRLAKEIIGINRHKETLLLARQRGAIDRGSGDIQLLKGADLVVLAAPVKTNLDLAEEIFKVIGTSSIVTDVSSTKEEIAKRLSKFFPKYVGSHPLAGSEKRGFIHASAHLFKDSLCVLTPLKNTETTALKKIRRLWKEVGARTVSFSPPVHDKVLSVVSHLPHIVAFSLMNSVPAKFLKFASTGLKDTTRLSASDAQLWRDVIFTNKKNLIRAITLFEKKLTAIKSAIRKNDTSQLMHILKQAQKKRLSLR